MWKHASKWRYLKKGVGENPREAFLVADDCCLLLARAVDVSAEAALEPHVISD